MNEPLSVFIAFGAGLLSFVSPCVLPLIPSYLCIIGGTPLEKDSAVKPKVVAGTVSFIVGFSAVFIVLSILLAVTFSLMGGVSRWISRISGAVVIVLGLNIMFDFLSFLNFEKRLHLTGKPKGIAGAFVAGAAFGAGWTPCVGPVLGSILLLAAQSGGIPQAVLYLVFYSAGLGLPFLLASLFFSVFLKASAKLQPHLPLIRRISGALLVVIGVLMVTGRYQALNALASQWQNRLTAGSAASSTGKPMPDDKGTAANTGDANVSTANAVLSETARTFRAAGLPILTTGVKPIDFSLPLLNGKTQTLSALNGNVVLLNFWATWCGPCRIEMPSMEALYQRLKDQGFAMLAVNLGEQADTVAGFMRENRLSFPVLLDESGTVGYQYGAQAIPTTYILNRQGLIVSRVVGSINWDTPEITAAFESLLAER